MIKKIVLIAVHGMGETKPDFAEGLEENLEKRVGTTGWGQVYFDTVFYQDILQTNQTRAMDAMKRRDIDWIKLRKFMLFGFSDAAGLERRSWVKNSPYHQAQKRIRDVLDKAYGFVGGSVPVILVTQSLGAQVLSNYIWDAQQTKPSQGTWKFDGKDADTKKDAFLRFKSMKYFFSSGCNIPIFVAGFDKDKIVAIKSASKGYAFRWKNFYDADDVLGWPLQPLSPSYKESVYKDYEINASSTLFGTIAQSWNPLSHTAYWGDKDFIKPLAKDILSLL
jgi:hypothetical protein